MRHLVVVVRQHRAVIGGPSRHIVIGFVSQHLAGDGADGHDLEVVAAVGFEGAQMLLDKQAAHEVLLAERAPALRTLGLLHQVARDAYKAEQVSVLALPRVSQQLQADAALQLARKVRVDDAVLDREFSRLQHGVTTQGTTTTKSQNNATQSHCSNNTRTETRRRTEAGSE